MLIRQTMSAAEPRGGVCKEASPQYQLTKSMWRQQHRASVHYENALRDGGLFSAICETRQRSRSESGKLCGRAVAEAVSVGTSAGQVGMRATCFGGSNKRGPICRFVSLLVVLPIMDNYYSHPWQDPNKTAELSRACLLSCMWNKFTLVTWSATDPPAAPTACCL